MIQIASLSQRYDALNAVDSLDVIVPPGERFGLMVPNGAGQTTAMRMLAGNLMPTSGTVRLAGHDVLGGAVPP